MHDFQRNEKDDQRLSDDCRAEEDSWATRLFQVTCTKKRGTHVAEGESFYKPHERIEGIGGIIDGNHWYLSESLAIEELEKPAAAKAAVFFIIVNRQRIPLVVTECAGRKYLKTPNDGYAPDHLLFLPDCP
jgi:hypothetical protein